MLLGMMAESFIDTCKGLLLPEEERDINQFLSFYVDFDFSLKNRALIYDLIKGDKKNEGNRILCTLLHSIGKYAINQEINLEEVEQSLVYLERSEEHTSELQSRGYLVCRLLLETKNNIISV